MTTHDHNRSAPQEELLLSLIEDELDPAREAAALATLDAASLARLEKMRRHRTLLRGVGEVPAPAGLVDRAIAVLEREAVTGPSISDRSVHTDAFRIDQYQARPAGLWQRRLAIAAGLALLVGGAGYWALRLAPGPGATGLTGATGPIASTTQPSDSTTTTATTADSRTLASADLTRDDEPAPAPAIDEPQTRAAIASATPSDVPVDTGYSPADFDDPETFITIIDGPLTDEPIASAADWSAESAVMPVTMGVFSDMPTSLDPEHAARLADEGRLVIRVRADRPAIAAARLLCQADNRTCKGRMYRLMPCPPPDFTEAAEAALPPARDGLAVPYRTPMRPVIETTLSIELDPSASSIAMIQAELELIARGSVILDMLDQPVTMAPPCGEEGNLRGWTSSPTSVVHSVVVPLVVESNE